MIAYLFPGQGSQYPGMLQDLPDENAVHETLDVVSKVLGRDVREFDTADSLSDTVAAQVALFTVGVALARLVGEKSGITPDIVAGHSIGAFPAAVSAGVLTVEEGLSAVLVRSTGMRDLYPSGFGLIALLGARMANVEKLVADVRGEDDLYIAMENAEDQIVLAGSDGAFERVDAAAARFGIREVRRLDVAVPSHCALMTPVAEAVAANLEDVPPRKPTIRYLSAMTARSARTGADVLADLSGGVAHMVRWRDTTDLLAELEPSAVVQISPGHATAALFASAHPSLVTMALDDAPLSDSLIRLSRVVNTQTT
jgi:malonate decarboxylase epsilon subunit